MKYNFDEVIERKNTNCLKYDFAVQRGRPADVLPLWVADMDFRTAPEIINVLKERAEHGIFGYTKPDKSYFNTVTGWFKNRHGWSPRPDAFVVTCGVVFALCALVRTVTEVGDAVMVCQPVYYPFMDAIEDNGRKLVISELKYEDGRYTVDYEDFERKIVENKAKAFILCSPHNPVGRVWTREELERMGDICLKHGVFVLSDEIHADFTFGCHKHTVFASVKKEYEDICAVCTAPTKTFNLAGLQISNIYIPNDKIREAYIKELGRVGYCECGSMGLTACVAAYEHGADWLDELKEYLTKNLNLVHKILKEVPQIKLVEPEGTYLVWLDCRSLNLSDEELQNLMERKAGLWLDDGYIFGKSGSGFERINIACPRSLLKTALEKFVGALR